MRKMRKKEAIHIFGREEGKFDRRNQPTASYDGPNAYERCRRNIMRIHHNVIVMSGEIREIGLEDALINGAALDGLCDRFDYCEDCFERAALAIDYIANFHPFAEGNKRTSFMLAVCLLRIGGYELDDDHETYQFMRDVASGLYDREEVEVWLRCNAHVSSP